MGDRGWTVQDVIDLATAAAPGFPGAGRTVDTLKAGKPGDVVRGIVVTFVATGEVLRRAGELGANLVITHEPTFYDHLDDVEGAGLAGDAVVAAKRRLIEELGLAVWRCHDVWHRVPGDGILIGMAKTLGWEAYQDADPAKRGLFRLPGSTLGELVEDLKTKLGIERVRVMGDLTRRCTGVALSPGCTGWENHRRMLNWAETDVLVCGEGREWETCEYVRDLGLAGRAKGMVVLGHCNSEEAGMAYLADWLRDRITIGSGDAPGGRVLPGVGVHFVPAGDPFGHR